MDTSPSNGSKGEVSETSVVLKEEDAEMEEKVTLENVTDYKATSIALIEKLLQFSSPRLDNKIVNVLFLEGMMDILMTHITRLDLTQDEPIELSKCSIEQKLRHASHERDTKDMEALKRSYHAMEFLSGATANHIWVQNSKFYTIVNYLFNVFLPNSHGNFNHFFRIFQHFVRRYPCEMLDYVILCNDATILFDYMLPYISESSVMDSILSLIFIRDINVETTRQRERSHDKLHELKFLNWIIQALQTSDHPEFTEAIYEFLLRVIEESSQVENGDVLFESLDANIIQVLAKKIYENPPCKIRKKSTQVVKLLVKSGMLNTRASLTPIQGPLYQISIRSQKLLVEYLTEFSSLIIKERGKTNDTNEYPLSLSDIDLLEIIYHILSNMDEKSQMLASIHTDFWKILVNSFFEKSSNNIYHTLFYRIFILLVSSYDEMTIAIIINESCLIQRLVDEYQNKAKKTDTRGYSLLILNHLRLMSDAQQSNTVTEIIANHTCYQSFLPTLRNDTLTQFQRIYSWELDGPRPPAHFGPSPPIQATHFSPYVGTMPLITNINNADYDGIDLGSEFAHSLGFNGTVGREEGFETPSEYLSRRNSDLSISSSQSSGSGPPVDMLFESLTPEEVTVPSKKKKKKKTKRYKW